MMEKIITDVFSVKPTILKNNEPTIKNSIILYLLVKSTPRLNDNEKKNKLLELYNEGYKVGVCIFRSENSYNDIRKNGINNLSINNDKTVPVFLFLHQSSGGETKLSISIDKNKNSNELNREHNKEIMKLKNFMNEE